MPEEEVIPGYYFSQMGARNRQKILAHKHLHVDPQALKEKRYKRKKEKGGSPLIQNRVRIENRPQVVNERGQFMDFEANTVLSSRRGKSCLAVFVERKSRLYLFKKISNKSTLEMTFATVDILRKNNPKTITYDNGSENVFHDLTDNILNCRSFFYNPYHSWEKGAIKNRNKILRQFFLQGL